jgi:hypothetical protein
LADAEQVPLTVPEPSGPLANASRRVVPLDLGDAVNRPKARDIDLLEDHPAAPQLLDHGLDVVDLPRHLGMAARRHASRLKQRKVSAAAPVAQATGPLLDRFQAELLGIERSRPRKILSRQPGGHVTVLKHAASLAHPNAHRSKARCHSCC